MNNIDTNLYDIVLDEVLYLIERAENKKHLNIPRIENLSDYSYAKDKVKRTKTYEKCFHLIAKKSFTEYVESLIANKRQAYLLVDANKLEAYADFYREETAMWQASINEYISYLRQGHIIDMLLGRNRED